MGAFYPGIFDSIWWVPENLDFIITIDNRGIERRDKRSVWHCSFRQLKQIPRSWIKLRSSITYFFLKLGQ